MELSCCGANLSRHGVSKTNKPAQARQESRRPCSSHPNHPMLRMPRRRPQELNHSRVVELFSGRVSPRDAHLKRRKPWSSSAPLTTLSIGSLDMCSTCKYANHMSRMIQIRNVPDPLHRTLKIRATMAGMSLSDYLLAELRQVAERPTLHELRDRLHQRAPLRGRLSAAQAVRVERDAR